jgi:NitT/TauT family transport system substrate-binding protein
MFRRQFLAGMLGVAGATLASRASEALQRGSIRIATGVTPPSLHNIFLHVAYERGFFARNGLDVRELVQLRGGPLAMQAIAARQVDLVPADPEGLLAATSNGHAVRGVLSPGARLSYMVAVRKEIETIADLRGKTFAISRPGAISQYLMYPLLDRAGVPRNSIQWVGVGGGFDRMLALVADRVKGALLNVDYAMEVESDPNIRIVQSVAEVLPDYPVELLVLRKEMLDASPDSATAIVTAVIQACRFIVRAKTATIDVMRQYNPGMDREVLSRAYDELIRVQGFGVNGGMTEANLKIAHDLALQNGQIARAVPLDDWVDMRFQRRALESLGPFSA